MLLQLFLWDPLNWLLPLQSFNHDKSSSISQLMKAKSKAPKKLLKYFFNGKTTYVFNLLLLAGVPPIIFVLFSKDLLVFVLLLFTL